MTETSQTALVLGGTGRTGSLVAKNLAERGMGARTAARTGADVRFDWDEPTTYRGALDGVETLLAPEAHAGAQYAPTGPQALTVGEVADTIAAVTGQSVTHNDIDPDTWIGGAVAAGLVPADYAVMLRWLTGSIISGNGSAPNDDVEKVTGRPPAPFGDFARRSRHAWTSPAAR
jgi:uncharacterized protein YbjT (DUF2867 family)